MRKLVFIALMFISFINLSSQNIVQLHPMVGDTINSTEKMVFYLFSEIKDGDFFQGIIYYRDSTNQKDLYWQIPLVI